MRTQRILIALIGVTAMLALLWQARANADTLGVYQPPVVRQAQWALQQDNPEQAVPQDDRRGGATADTMQWEPHQPSCRTWRTWQSGRSYPLTAPSVNPAMKRSRKTL